MMKISLRIVIIGALLVAAYACSSSRRMSRFEIDYMVAETDRMIVLDDLDSAALLINDLARKTPDDTLVLFRQGIINRQLETVEGRIKSERAFRELAGIDSKNARYHLELGKTLIAQSFEMEGRGQLAWAIDLDPTLEEAYLLMARLYRRPYFVDDDSDRADSALYILGRLLKAAPKSDSGLIILAELCAARGELDSAETAANEVLKTNSSSKQPNMVMGYVQYRRERFESAARYFEKGLAEMDSLERSGYESILYLIPPQNASKFTTLSPERRESLRREFWFEVDVDPTTPVNERQVEHYARVWLANLLYTDSRWDVTGWTTDMGETLIRLGAPDERQRGKILSGKSNGAPTWYWYYTSTEYPCTLAFVDHMMSGTYRFPFAYSDNTGSARANSSKEIAYLNYRKAPQESTVERTRTPINLFAEAYKFAGDDSLTEVQLVAMMPASEISDPANGEMRCVVHGKGGVEVWRSEQMGNFAMVANEANEDSLTGSRIEMRIPAGRYRLSLAIDQQAKRQFGVITDSLIVPDFRGDEPAISDVVLGHSPSGQDKGAAILRDDTARVLPAIDQVFSLSEPLRLYYEIYNLPTDIRSLTRFDVTYTFQFIKGSEKGIKGLFGEIFPGKKESVSYTYREGGKSRNVIRDVELDVGELRPGRYRLTISANELVIGATVSRVTELTLIE
ncbi:MAG: GWxTD domain-containing protein [Candidatus Zixiibacteriota bacterium]